VSTLPSGIVTFLFSDVEGSTRLVRDFGDARWAELLETHRQILRRAFSANDGREVSTQGDAFFAVFARASDAVAAAIAGQRALEAHPWPENIRVRVRIGIHTGEALADGDNYTGQEVHRASRICDAGHGGQIVVSKTTAELVRAGVGNGAVLTDLGDHRLKDMGDAQRLFQLTATGLPSQFSPLRSLSSASNLPAERSSFVGRQKELAAIRRILATHRLVTLTGIGGSGKTRLALQIGALELASFPDGVFFVDLAPVTDPELVSHAIATAFASSFGDALGGSFDDSIDDRVLASLARRTCLLLVDNCEHLVDTVAALIDRILVACPTVSVLSTSREALGLDGEQIVPVPSLAVPDDPSQAEGSEAVQLFTERAKAVKPAFALGPDNLSFVIEICRRLDGIPLAIELAATRVAHLSPRQVAERLADRFRLLTGGRRRIQRQQTLAAALDWSHDLLSEEERTLFRRLAVFAGGFSLDAAEAIGSGGAVPASAVLDILGSLAAKSLVAITEDERGNARYRLLETVRMYASDKLAAAAEAEAVRTRHRDWYLAWLEAMPLELLSSSPSALRVAIGEIDNLRAAADWCVSNDQPQLLARLSTRLSDYWAFGSAYEEGRRWLFEALRGGDRLATPERVACHAMLAGIAMTGLDRDNTLEHANRAVELSAGEASPFLVLALSRRAFGISVLASAPGADPALAADARRDIVAAIATASDGLAMEWRIQALGLAAMTEMNLGDLRAAALHWNALLQLCGDTAEPHTLTSLALPSLAVSLHLVGDNDGALRVALRAREFWRRRSTFSSFAMPSYFIEMTPALVVGGRQEIAFEVLRDAIRNVRRVGIPLAENHLLSVIAVVEYLRGSPDRAGRLLAVARHLSGATTRQIPFRTPGSLCLYRYYLPVIRAGLGSDEARRARDEGQAMTLDVALAYALEGLS